MQVRCDNCVWKNSEQCDSNIYGYEQCSYYPVIEEVSDEEAKLLVEEGRKEYYDAWKSYINEPCYKGYKQYL